MTPLNNHPASLEKKSVEEIQRKPGNGLAWLKEQLRTALRATPVNALLEQRSMRRWYDYKYQSLQSIEQAIASIQSRWNIEIDDDKEEPIFIFASGWRSGSTLLQRLVNSDNRIMLWGEPFPDSNLVQTMANSLKPFQTNYPPDSNFLQSDNFTMDSSPLWKRWTANLYPSFECLHQSHRAFFETLYAAPAREQNCSRWGFKEVRLGIEHAIYLKWLFPKAKFLFLYRNPYHAYRSCYDWRNLYWQWPDEGVFSPTIFGQYWVTQVTGFLTDYQKVDGHLIKYEELCNEDDAVAKLSSYLEADIDPTILKSRIGSSKNKKSPPIHSVKQLEKIVAPLAESLGYQRDG
ncbi:MAG: sulfotransferase [Cyanobacteria bacterium P01_A01_bin.37]